MKPFLEVHPQSDFSIYNIPFGVALIDDEKYACVTRLGDTVINLSYLYEKGYFKDVLQENVFNHGILNHFMELGKKTTVAVRNTVQQLLCEGSELSKDTSFIDQGTYSPEDVDMVLPVFVSNYTDFYSSQEHATNVGKMFRDPENALLPNWKHIPVGYHGRASSIIVSDIPIIRPNGQTKPNENEPPVFGPTKLLDFELEMAFVTCSDTDLGENISVENARDHIFGMLLFNDWSARDIQKWEYVPLGPFLSKNFASSVSPWIVTLEALEPFKTPAQEQDVAVLPYLQQKNRNTFDIQLEVYIQTPEGEENKICTSNYKNMYWTMDQQLAHHTVNGCNIEVGDMYASGTISGTTEDSFGSMLELTWRGSKPITLKDGSQRKFIQDNDTVIMKGFAENEGVRVGFGEVRTLVLPANSSN